MKRSHFTLLLILFGCALKAQTTVTFRLDPGNARGGSTGQIFDSVQFIPLETSKESLFGSIDQLEMTDSLFIILDVRGHSILLFFRTGKFYKRIATGGIDKYFYWFTLDNTKVRIISSMIFADQKGTIQS